MIIRCRNLLCQYLLILAWAGLPLSSFATLTAYDNMISEDASAGLTPVAKLTSAVTLSGANRAPFDFGQNAGDVTIEFVLEGNPAPSAFAAYLAVGSNTASNLRFEQFNNTGQLGFTQLGVADYLFSPAVPSPNVPVHIAYVWNATSRTMALYLNGTVAGTRSSVSAAFALPRGAGYLGANPSNGENMTGTIYRVTVYDEILPDATIQRHSDAYNDVVRPPILVSFTANPTVIFTPDSSTLSWNIQNASAVFLNGMDVTGTSTAVVSPTQTTIYSLVATNAGGSVTGSVTVVVNPAPIIDSFRASKGYAAAGEIITLSWNVRYGEEFSISPGIGDVTPNTLNGMGSIAIQMSATTTLTLSASNAHGTSEQPLQILLVHPANHLVISEFVADNESGLRDEDGNFSDWIEIFNPTTSTVDLLGYYLTDDESEPTKWPFPSTPLGPGQHLVVFASGNNRTNPAAALHTNFQLDKDGEYLALIGPGPSILHEFDPFPPQRANVSYGVLGGDLATERYIGVVTPGAANDDTPAPPAPVTFSHASGTFVSAFNLTLASDTAGAEIRYTLNGSPPSATNGSVYSAPIAINATTRVRAVAVVGGQISEITSVDFIKLGPDLINYTSTLPIMVIENFGAGPIPEKGWTGNGEGIKQLPRQLAAWATFDRSNGVSSLASVPQMFASIGIRARGGASSQWRQRPYSVEAIDEYGGEEDVAPLDLPAHADWVLYFPDADTSNSKDSTLLFNTFAYQLSANWGRYAVRFRWVEAFINTDGGELRLADRRGVYVILEKVSRGEDRLNFERLSADGSSGGWLVNINRMDPEPENGWPAPNGATRPWFFHTAGPNRILQTPDNIYPVVGDDEPQQINAFINFDNPNGYTINTNQRGAMQNWFKEFEDVLWNNAIWRDPINGYRKYLDEVDFADFFVMNVLTLNSDGLLISLFPWKGDDNKLRMGPVWDFNYNTYYNFPGGPTGALLHRSERLWYRRLFADPDFLQLYIDRWWQHRRGPMSNAAMDAIIDEQAAEITPAKAILNGVPSAIEWSNRLAQFKTWLKTRANWIDGNYIRPPILNQDGGDVPDGFQVTILGTNGTIYYTIDGSDPRAPGGAVASGALGYQAPFPITVQTIVQARIRNGTNWSGLTRGVFYPPQDLSKLVVTEIMYHPAPFGAFTADDLEFLELKNTGSHTLHLGTLTFAEGITFNFTNGTRLNPGQFFILARNATAFTNRYPGIPANGVYTARLDNGGEVLRLATLAGGTVFSVDYNDREPWPITADGHGFSVVPRNATANPNSDNGAHWRASAFMGGSPGADDPETTFPAVVVSEVLSHSVPPDVDWIELQNLSSSQVDISGWFLSDDPAAPKKYRIPDGTILEPEGFQIFIEGDFNDMPGSIFSFALDSAGDSIYLTSADAGTNLTGYSHGFTFGAAAADVTFGRYVNSTGEEQFPPQFAATLNAPNFGPVVGPVVIQEIMYHPETGRDEFVEIKNISGSDLPLYNPARPINTWRIDGLAYTFPTNLTLPANGLLLVVATNPAGFRAKYSIPAEVQIVGPFFGVLQDSGERLELQRPDMPPTNGPVPYIGIDQVRYNDKLPWPPAADGSGASLQRRIPGAYGNDPINWVAAIPTPGEDFVPGQGPTVTSHPQNQTVLSFEDAQFTVSADGDAPLFYQWLFNGNVIPDATNSTLLLPNVHPSQAGNYSAVIFNDFGSTVSAAARLTVNRVPNILSAPTNNFTRPGGTAFFSVTAVGNGPLTYQWNFNGAAIAGATTNTLMITNVQSSHEGAYSVVISDSVASTVGGPVSLRLAFDPLIVQHPLSQSVAQGGSVTFSVVITNTANLPITNRWRRAGSFVQTNIINGYIDFYTVTNAQPGAQNTNYVVWVFNPARPAGLVSSVASLNVLADSDRDGLPDNWEVVNGFETNNAADATNDFDLDTMLNWQEYVAGTDPTNALSYLKVQALQTTPETNHIEFYAVSNRTYSVLYKNALPDSDWSKLVDFPARATNHVQSALDAAPADITRFYRLVTPAQR